MSSKNMSTPKASSKKLFVGFLLFLVRYVSRTQTITIYSPPVLDISSITFGLHSFPLDLIRVVGLIGKVFKLFGNRSLLVSLAIFIHSCEHASSGMGA